MTTPSERTRALKWAREFLLEIRNPDIWPSVPEELRHQAEVILRHYPDPGEMEHLHRLAPSFIAITHGLAVHEDIEFEAPRLQLALRAANLCDDAAQPDERRSRKDDEQR